MTVSSFALVAGAQTGYVGFRFGTAGTLTPSMFSGAEILRAEHDLTGIPVFTLLVTGVFAQDAFDSLVLTNTALGNITYNSASAIFLVSGGNTTWAWPQAAATPLFVAASSYTMEIDTGINYNCECNDTTNYETLATLRTRLLKRLGYAAQVSNPPPGMAALLDDFLQSSQKLLYTKYTELRTERFFTWTMAAGVRLYDLPDNDESCSKKLNALKLSWVGVEDLNGAWLPLTSGISPTLYTGITMNSIPQRYEIRQCIEVFPPPDAAYKLRIKGHYLLQSFTADADQTTIDSELVFLWALATAKAHYGHPDANNIAAMANTYLGDLVAGKHGTKRYVPGGSFAPPVVRPVMRGGYDA
jgi:hypothetical protein